MFQGHVFVYKVQDYIVWPKPKISIKYEFSNNEYR